MSEEEIKMEAQIIAAVIPMGLISRLQSLTSQGWEIQGGLCYGDGMWAVLLVRNFNGKE